MIQKLRENLLPPPPNCKDENTGRGLELQSYGLDQHWIRTGAVTIRSGELTLLRRRAKVAEEWAKLFDGKKCKLSNRFLSTLTQFGLHNMRGSDEGAELLIAGVINALAMEVGLPLSNVALSYGCSSCRTLAR